MEQFKPAIRYGVIMGVVNVIVFLAMYAIDPVIFAKTSGLMLMLAINAIAIPIVFIILSMRDTKVGFSFFSFGDALKAGVITAGIATLIALVFNILFITVIDPAWEAMVMEETINTAEEWLEKSGLPEEAIEQAIDETRAKMEAEPRGIVQQLKGMIIYMGWYLVLSLIIGAIYRDKKEDILPEISDIGE